MGEFTHAMRNPIKERDDRIAMLEARVADYDRKFAEAAVALQKAGVEDWEEVPGGLPGDVKHLSLAERIKKLKIIQDEDEETINYALGHARKEAREEQKKFTDAAYTERNKLAVLLAHTAFLRGWKAGRSWDLFGEPGWQNVVIIDLPTGQVSWHVGQADVESTRLRTLPKYDGKYDGHSTDEKWARVSEYIRELTAGFEDEG